MGKIDCLNTGKGHAEIKIDDTDPIELERGKRIISDMLRRGYALFVHGPDGKLSRVEQFKPDTMTYVIGMEPAGQAEERPPAPKSRGRPRKGEVSAATSHVTAIAPSAGG